MARVRYGEYKGYNIMLSLPNDESRPVIVIADGEDFVTTVDTVKKAKEAIDRMLVRDAKFKPFEAYYRGMKVRITSVSKNGRQVNMVYDDGTRGSEYLGVGGEMQTRLFKAVTNRNDAIMRDIAAKQKKIAELSREINDAKGSMDNINAESIRMIRMLASARRGK
jgi:hypothetical protein